MNELLFCKLPYKLDSGDGKRRPFSNIQNVANKFQDQEHSERIKGHGKSVFQERENVVPNFQNVDRFEKPVCGTFDLYGDKIEFDFTEADFNFKTNHVLVTEIFFQMKKDEEEIRRLFRKPSNKIGIKMRYSFIDWFIYTTEYFKFNTETLHLAVRYAEEYLFEEEVCVTNMLLVGTSAVFLACKLEECREDIPEINKFIEHARIPFTKYDIFEMEQKMLKVMNFKMTFPTSYHFLQIYCQMLKVNGEVNFLAQYLCDIALIYEEIYYSTVPSRIAAAALALSSHLLCVQPGLDDIEFISGFDEIDLKLSTTLLFAKFHEIQSTDFRNVKRKYNSLIYLSASLKDYPKSLVVYV